MSKLYIYAGIVASVILIGLWVFSAIRLFWKWWLLLVWLFGLLIIGGLMWGGFEADAMRAIIDDFHRAQDRIDHGAGDLREPPGRLADEPADRRDLGSAATLDVGEHLSHRGVQRGVARA